MYPFACCCANRHGGILLSISLFWNPTNPPSVTYNDMHWFARSGGGLSIVRFGQQQTPLTRGAVASHRDVAWYHTHIISMHLFHVVHDLMPSHSSSLILLINLTTNPFLEQQLADRLPPSLTPCLCRHVSHHLLPGHAHKSLYGCLQDHCWRGHQSQQSAGRPRAGNSSILSNNMLQQLLSSILWINTSSPPIIVWTFSSW